MLVNGGHQQAGSLMWRIVEQKFFSNSICFCPSPDSDLDLANVRARSTGQKGSIRPSRTFARSRSRNRTWNEIRGNGNVVFGDVYISHSILFSLTTCRRCLNNKASICLVLNFKRYELFLTISSIGYDIYWRSKEDLLIKVSCPGWKWFHNLCSAVQVLG